MAGGLLSGSKILPGLIRIKLAHTPPGTTFKVSVLRAGKVIELTGTAAK